MLCVVISGKRLVDVRFLGVLLLLLELVISEALVALDSLVLVKWLELVGPLHAAVCLRKSVRHLLVALDLAVLMRHSLIVGRSNGLAPVFLHNVALSGLEDVFMVKIKVVVKVSDAAAPRFVV